MSLINPITLPKLTLANNLIQAPLAGYSCAPFRVLTTRYGNPGFCTTEMISATDLVHRKHKPKRYLWRDPEEKKLCYQLSGSDPDILQRAVEIVAKHGADIIDLNCGCPVNKIRSKNSGSKLLVFPEKIHALVRAMKSNTDATVSIKIRVANQLVDHDDFAVVDAAQSAGVDFITVHGRNWCERYDVACHHESIAAIVRYARVPIIANGDVDDVASFKKIISETGCAGVMIARASVGRPWLFQEIIKASNNEPFVAPSFSEIAAIFLEHIERLMDLENEKLAVLQARKFAKYYARELPHRTEFVTAIQKATSYQDANKQINVFFTVKASATLPT